VADRSQEQKKLMAIIEGYPDTSTRDEYVAATKRYNELTNLYSEDSLRVEEDKGLIKEEEPKIRTLEQIANDTLSLNKDNAEIIVKDTIEKIEVPDNQRESLYADLLEKLSPIAGWAKEQVGGLLENDFVQSTTNDLKRQLGLTVRAAGEGTANIAGIAYDPISVIVELADKIVRGDEATDIPQLSTQMATLLDSIGVPKPENTVERIVNVVGQGAVGGGGSASISTQLAKLLQGTSKKVASIMATNPLQQTAAGGSAGAAMQGTDEAGYGPAAQFGASLFAGGLTGKLTNQRTIPISDRVRETVSEAEKLGVPVLTSDVRPPGTFAGKSVQIVSESVPVVGTGDIRKLQQADRINAIQEFAKSWGVDLGDDVKIIETVAKDLFKRRGVLFQQASNSKNKILNDPKLQVESAGTMLATKTLKVIDDEIDQLKSLNNPDLAPVIKTLNGWKESLINGTQTKSVGTNTFTVANGQSFANVEKLRKLFGESFKSNDMASVREIGQASLNKIYGPLIEEMGDFIKTHVGVAASKRWKTANSKLSGLIGELDNSLFKSVMKKGEVSPEEVSRILFSKKPSDVKLLLKNLDATGLKNAKTAMISSLYRKSLGNIDEGIPSPEKFKTELKKMSEQMGIVFSEQELDSIKGLGRVLEMTQRAGQANVVLQTGGGMVSIPIVSSVLTNLLGGIYAGLGAYAGIGGLARFFESSATRNILMKLPTVRPGSRQEAELIKRLNEVIILEQSRETGSDDQVGDQSGLDNSEIVVSENSPTLESIIEQINPSASNKILAASNAT
jgi:hypothetical protein